MSDTATLLALADRIEKEGPSRELDEAIVAATGLAFTSITMPPPFTSSLDAAVTLVPANASWSLEVRGACEASVSLPTGRFLVSEDIERFGRSGVPAMALCAAALRALAAQDEVLKKVEKKVQALLPVDKDSREYGFREADAYQDAIDDVCATIAALTASKGK